MSARIYVFKVVHFPLGGFGLWTTELILSSFFYSVVVALFIIVIFIILKLILVQLMQANSQNPPKQIMFLARSA